MKNLIPICFLLSSIIFFACKKENNSEQQNVTTESKLPREVNTWLDQQKSSYATAKNITPNKDANVDLLKKNVDFTAVKMEPIDNNFDFLIVPIKDEVVNKKALKKNSTLSLFLLINKIGKVHSGGIIYFEPADGKKRLSLPQGALSFNFDGKADTLDGVYKILSVTGKWISQFEVKDGKLFSTGSVEQKIQTDQNNQKTNSVCVDWWLVITYHLADGSTYETREYVGRTCDGCDNSDYMSLCPDGGGGSGGSGDLNNDIPDAYGDEKSEISYSEIPPGTGSGPNSPNSTELLHVHFQAWVSWQYSYRFMVFIYIRPNKPFPVPVSQPFTDDDGHPAAVYYGVDTWNHSLMKLTPKSERVIWNFVSTRHYAFTTGPIFYTFNEILSKVIAAP